MRLPLRWPAAATAALIGLCATLPATAAPRLRCEIHQGGEDYTLMAEPTQDPYRAKPLDLRGRFRFKAVVFGTAQQVDYVKLYGYYLTGGQPVLLHEAKYLQPAMAPAGAAPDSLTGTHYIFSPVLGREMQYGCSLVEVQS